MFQTQDFETFDIKICLASKMFYFMDLSVYDIIVRPTLLGMPGPIYKLWSDSPGNWLGLRYLQRFFHPLGEFFVGCHVVGIIVGAYG